MIKKLIPLALLITLCSGAIAQTEKKTGRPDIPGTFVMDLGINRLTEKPNELKYGLWGSRTVNVYYLYDIRIGKSKFTFHPGIGLGMERFKFQSFKEYFPTDTLSRVNPTLIYDAQGNTKFIEASHFIYDADSLGQPDYSESYSTKKSMLAMNYLDIPVELRFNTNPDDPARSFKVAIGGRAGYLINGHTKIKYKEDGDLKKVKNHQDFNLSKFRYSVYLKVYMGNFNIFGYYNLNPMFEGNKGPGQTKGSSYTVGISLASF
jgi:hypothetical protein